MTNPHSFPRVAVASAGSLPVVSLSVVVLLLSIISILLLRSG